MHVLLPWLLGGLLSLIVIGVLAALFLVYEVVKQQGRLLLRLDQIEGQVGRLAQAQRPTAPPGLPVGELFTSFKLPALSGREVALEGFLGKKVLLVNWSPNCGYCVRIAKEMGRLKRAFPAHNVELVLASYGDEEANRKLAGEHGLEDSVVLRQDAPPIQAFESFGTPSAYLLDENGRVAKTIAVGSNLVPILGGYAVGEVMEAELTGAEAASKGTCGQQNGARPAAAQTVPGKGPGTELKKMLAKLGIAVTADCPCNERAATMDGKGWEWCEQNLETIVGWMREESARRGTLFIEVGARFLVRRAIAKARRSDDSPNDPAVNELLIPDRGETS